jgi:hypothetical protein
VASVTGIAVFAAQHMAVHAQAGANPRAPGDISAVRHGHVIHLQRAPAALGFERGDAVVFNPHLGKHSAQGGFERGGFPVVGQAARGARQAAANIGCGQLDQALVQHKRSAGRHANPGDALDRQLRRITALTHEADDLPAQRVLGAGGRGGLGHLAANTLVVNDVDRHLGAANVHAGHRRRTVGQLEALGHYI